MAIVSCLVDNLHARRDLGLVLIQVFSTRWSASCARQTWPIRAQAHKGPGGCCQYKGDVLGGPFVISIRQVRDCHIHIYIYVYVYAYIYIYICAYTYMYLR